MLAETGWERDISVPRVIGKAVSEREFAWGADGNRRTAEKKCEK